MFGIGKIVSDQPPGKSLCLDGTWSTFGSGGGRCSYHGGVFMKSKTNPRKKVVEEPVILEKNIIGTWYRNLAINKYVIDFDYEGYKAMGEELKGDLRKFFRWNRYTKKWNSKATLDGNNYMAKRVLESLPIKFGGTIGDRDFQKELDKKKANTAYFDQTGNESIEPYRNLFSESFNRSYSSSAGFFDRNLNNEMVTAVDRKIDEVLKRYNFDSIDQIPDYLIKAINRYISGYQKFLERKANISIYAPNWIVTGRSNYPVHRLEKARSRTGNNFKLLDDINRKFQKALRKYEDSRPSTYSQPYLANKLLDLQKQLKRIDESMQDQNYQGGQRIELEGKRKYVQDQIQYFGKILYGDQGGIKYNKTRLIAENASLIKYRGQWYPIKRVNQKTVTVSNWLNVPDMEWKVPYVEVADHK